MPTPPKYTTVSVLHVGAIEKSGTKIWDNSPAEILQPQNSYMDSAVMYHIGMLLSFNLLNV